MDNEVVGKNNVYVAVYNSSGEIFIVELPEPDPRKQYFQKYSLSAYGSCNKDNIEDFSRTILAEQLNIDEKPVFLGNIEDVYFFCLKQDGNLKVYSKYAEKGQWVPPEVIENMMLQDPDIFTPSFLVFWNNFRDRLEF